jgi:hypothetical protein
MTLQHLRKVQIFPWDMARIANRKEEKSVLVGSAVSFRPYQDGGVKGMENGAVAQDEGDDSRFVLAMKVKSQLQCRAIYSLPESGRHRMTSINHTRNCSHADPSFMRYGDDPYLSRWFSHSLVRPFSTT